MLKNVITFLLLVYIAKLKNHARYFLNRFFLKTFSIFLITYTLYLMISDILIINKGELSKTKCHFIFLLLQDNIIYFILILCSNQYSIHIIPILSHYILLCTFFFLRIQCAYYNG